MSNLLLSYELADILTQFNVDVIMLLHQVCCYTNGIVLSNLYSLCIRDNILYCDTYREYILRVSMIKLTRMSRYVTSNMRYSILRHGPISHRKIKNLLSSQIGNVKEIAEYLVLVIDQGMNLTNMLESGFTITMIQQIVVYLEHEYYIWRDNDKVKDFVVRLTSLYDSKFIRNTLRNKPLLLLLLNSVSTTNFVVCKLFDVYNLNVQSIKDKLHKDIDLFINGDDSVSQTAIRSVLYYSDIWVKHISVKHIEMLLCETDLKFVSYVITCLSPVGLNLQLDSIRQCIIDYNKHSPSVIHNVISILLVRYKRIDLYKLLKSWVGSYDGRIPWNDTDTGIDYSSGEFELYMRITTDQNSLMSLLRCLPLPYHQVCINYLIDTYPNDKEQIEEYVRTEV